MKTKSMVTGSARLLPTLLCLMLSLFATRALADKFSQKNSNGVTIYYDAYYEEGVTDPIIKVTSNPNYYEGTVVIPEAVSYNGKQLEVKAIGEGAFNGCGNLTSVTIPSGVIWIENFAFRGCWKLTSVNIPDKVTLIGVEAFNGCCALESINIPNSVDFISSNAFLDCTSLRTVNIPSSVTDIGDCVFQGCTSLTSVTIPKSLKVIHDWMFRECTSLTSVVIPEGVETIGFGAFSSCTSLVSVTIPSTVTTISEEAFNDCRGLTTIKSFIQNPPEIEISTFSDYDKPTLYVPEGAINSYKAKNNWKFFTIRPITEQCATPTIAYNKGKLSFSSDTDGATCKWTITDEDVTTGEGNEVTLAVSYQVSVYATKTGYMDSEVATVTLCWLDVNPQNGGIVTGTTQLHALPVLIRTASGTISMEGLNNGTAVSVFDMNGRLQGSAVASGNTATISTTLTPGSIAIVKIGEKAVKVMMK